MNCGSDTRVITVISTRTINPTFQISNEEVIKRLIWYECLLIECFSMPMSVKKSLPDDLKTRLCITEKNGKFTSSSWSTTRWFPRETFADIALYCMEDLMGTAFLVLNIGVKNVTKNGSTLVAACWQTVCHPSTFPWRIAADVAPDVQLLESRPLGMSWP